MQSLTERMTCTKCGKERIKTNLDSPHAVCPDQCGRLSVVSEAEYRNFQKMKLYPRATKRGRNKYTIAGYDETYYFRKGNGQHKPADGEVLESGDLIAYLEVGRGLWIRIFSPKRATSSKPSKGDKS